MELRQYLNLVRKWWWLAVLGLILAGGTAYLVTSTIPPTYQSRTVLMIDQARTGVTDYSSIIASQRLAETYAQVIQSRAVLGQVQQNLGLPYPPAVSVSAVGDTQLLQIYVSDSNAERAQAIANEVAAVFIRYNDETQRGRFASSRQSLEAEMALTTKDIEATTTALQAYKSGAAGANLSEEARQAEIKRLETILAQYQSSYVGLVRNYETLRLTEAQMINTVTVVDAAQMGRQVGPNRMTNTLLAAAVGLALAVGVAFLVEYLDDTLKTSEDVQSVLAMPTLGSIARINPAKSAPETLIVAAHPKSHIAEAYRVLRTNIEFSSVDEPLRTLMVTSSSPSEGKSTTIANLGVALAESGKRVIIVDSDLRRPVQHKIFEAPNAMGLTNLLVADASNVEMFLAPTPVKNLGLLTCGPIPPNPAELLGSRRMAEVIRLLKEHADVVLFDSPPALAVTDAAVLGSQVDGVLLVVDAGDTRRGEAERAKAMLDQVGVHVLGAVLNRLKTSRSGSGYYYYYYSSEDGGKRRRRSSKQHKSGEQRWAWLPFVGK
ncbi:MAG: polysaccharide biosynthesis tyrosine autokinase [Chloroflexi bacterium]|nr:polysaccharide biosynthesis tyrosine autokinase [Chloroflexota bacterium]MBU1750878.1 polysaccharide biosynthesis tyrosine autokinase [Chloroflexota bacterium]MBU1879146.1 polysaccharide biosynthesis tyrosine autokinase [Chloroflexota bacterium]